MMFLKRLKSLRRNEAKPSEVYRSQAEQVVSECRFYKVVAQNFKSVGSKQWQFT